MQKLIIQPCSNLIARQNYMHTIQNSVSIQDISRYLTEDQKSELLKYFPEGNLRVWGVVDGSEGKHLPEWKSIKKGDVAVFTWDSAIRSHAIVFGKLVSAELSTYLWNDNRYKNIYFLGNIENVEISYKVFNKLLGYSKNFNYQGFRVLSEDKSLTALDYLGVCETSFTLDISHAEFEKAINKLYTEPTLDRESSGTQRKEQAFLRKQLFGENREAKCAICGKIFPVEFLVAAHIKRRSDCTLEERKDFENIVFSACKFGCDDLYEKGYILVHDGKYAINSKKWISSNIKLYLATIDGRACEKWNKSTIKYFNAHNSKFDL